MTTPRIAPVAFRLIDPAEDAAQWERDLRAALEAHPAASTFAVPREYVERALSDVAVQRDIARLVSGDVGAVDDQMGVQR